jgi:hypothetical protein
MEHSMSGVVITNSTEVVIALLETKLWERICSLPDPSHRKVGCNQNLCSRSKFFPLHKYFQHRRQRSIAMQRRLLHCTRRLRTDATKGPILPLPSAPDPVVPANPSLANRPETPVLVGRVSLNVNLMRKIPSQDWNEDDSSTSSRQENSSNPLATDRLQKDENEVSKEVLKTRAQKNIRALHAQDRQTRPPVPTNRISSLFLI